MATSSKPNTIAPARGLSFAQEQRTMNKDNDTTVLLVVIAIGFTAYALGPLIVMLYAILFM